jgi:hypothetical protein
MDINITFVTYLLVKLWYHAHCYKAALFKLSCLPANGTLTVGRSLRDAQRLPNLCLSQTQGQSPKFESFSKLLDFIQIDPIYNVAVRLVDGWLICAKNQAECYIRNVIAAFSQQFETINCHTL